MKPLAILRSSIAVQLVVSVLCFAIPVAASPAATGTPTATPDSVGFSSQRLERLHALIQQEVDQKQLAGAITILARHGKIIDYRTMASAIWPQARR